MWEQESEQYWNKRKKPQQVSLALLIGGGVTVLVVLVLGWRAFVSKDTGVVIKGAPIKLVTRVPAAQSSACREQAGESGEWGFQECSKICYKTKNLAPKPTAHRVCMDGCQAGANFSIVGGCSTTKSQSACVAEAQTECERPCEPMLEQHPRPQLYDICMANCNVVAGSGCARARQSLPQVAHVLEPAKRDEH